MESYWEQLCDVVHASRCWLRVGIHENGERYAKTWTMEKFFRDRPLEVIRVMAP